MTQESRTIYSALLAAQKEMGPLLKNATNPHFRNKYADLSAVIETITEPLHNNGLAFFQAVTYSPIEPHLPILRTIIADTKSGETIESEFPISCKDPQNPQAVGAAITYLRRYSLMAMTGLAPEDDDGNAASVRATGNGDAARNTAQNASTAPLRDVYPPRDSGHTPRYDESEARAQNRTNPNGPSEKQLKRLFAMTRQLGMSTEQVKAELYNAYGIESSSDLTRAQYSEYTDRLQVRIDGGEDNDAPF